MTVTANEDTGSSNLQEQLAQCQQRELVFQEKEIIVTKQQRNLEASLKGCEEQAQEQQQRCLADQQAWESKWTDLERSSGEEIRALQQKQKELTALTDDWRTKATEAAAQAEKLQSDLEFKTKELLDAQETFRVEIETTKKDMEETARNLKLKMEEKIAGVTKTKEQADKEVQNQKSKVEKLEKELAKLRRELNSAKDTITKLEKEVNYYYDLWAKYSKLFSNFLETNEMVQSIYQPVEATVLPILEQAKAIINENIPPSMVETQSIIQMHYCSGTDKLAKFSKLQELPPFVVVGTAALAKNCKDSLLYAELLVLVAIFYFSFLLLDSILPSHTTEGDEESTDKTPEIKTEVVKSSTGKDNSIKKPVKKGK